MILGTIIPPAIDGRLNILLQQSGGTMLIAGLLIAAVGIALSGYAGYRKEDVYKRQGEDTSDSDLPP